MTALRIGDLFPAGGPVPPQLVIGRTTEIGTITARLGEGINTLLTGPRRIGKTTVCDAACANLRERGSLVLRIEVPDRADGRDLLQLFIDRSRSLSSADEQRKTFRASKPLIEKILDDRGLPLDLSELGREAGDLPAREVIALPLAVADELGKPVVLYLDELQRAAAYEGGNQLVADLVDVYSGESQVTVLVDGSDQRAFELFNDAAQLGKLCDRIEIPATIPIATWREALPERFELAGLTITAEALGVLLDFGQGRPYATMTAARYAALNARTLGSNEVGFFDAQQAVSEAARHMGDDNV